MPEFNKGEQASDSLNTEGGEHASDRAAKEARQLLLEETQTYSAQQKPQEAQVQPECINGFPKLGGFDFTEEDIETTFSYRDEPKSATNDVIRQVANKADLDCSGTLSKGELEDYLKRPELGPKTKQTVNHMLNKFHELATFTKNDWSEFKDPDTRHLIEKYLKDPDPNEEISKKDLATISEFGAPIFIEFALESEFQKAIEADGKIGVLKGAIFGGGKVQAVKELAKQMLSHGQLRDKLLDQR